MIHFEDNQSLLNTRQKELLNQLLPTLNQAQKKWLADILTNGEKSVEASLTKIIGNEYLKLTSGTTNTDGSFLRIMYGTRSGNSQKLANNIHKQAIRMGIDASLTDLAEYDPEMLVKEKNIMLIISTDGEGEPTFSTELIYEFLFSKQAIILKELRYSVLALGDKSYPLFCKVGKDIDARLSELGAKRAFKRIDCDVDYEVDSSQWILSNLMKQNELSQTSTLINNHFDTVSPQEETGTKHSPYLATVIEKTLLTGKNSTKKVWHFKFSLADSKITYNPGDTLGINCLNRKELVEIVLKELSLNGETYISTYAGNMSLEEALTKYYELTCLVPAVVKELSLIMNNDALSALASNTSELDNYCYGRDIIDLIKDFDLMLSAQELVDNLRKLQPRLYSISSSLSNNPHEVDITVEQTEYMCNNRIRKGVCSSFLSNISQGDSVEIFIEENKSFRLPNDPKTPIIMICAGTGIAPYRAFLQERAISGIQVKNWLFFGDRNSSSDFLYHTDWQKHRESGLLSKLDVAFSRDQDEKIYVQHKLLENSKEVYQWIQEGAYLYLCGDKNQMARDVKTALLQILRTEGGFSEGGAVDFFRKLRRDRQFQEDVY